MRIAYLDCFSGMSGDMFLGALVDAGVPATLLEQTVAALDLGASLEVGRVQRSGISAAKVDVIVAGQKDLPREEHWREHHQAHKHEHLTGHDHGHAHEHSQPEAALQSHEHVHGREHGRGLKEIREIITRAPVSGRAQQTAIAIFEALGAAEAKVHDTHIENIHFHEVGAMDAIVDILCAAVGAEALGADQWICSPLNVGGGAVECSHGRFPIPAPATLELLKDAPVYSSGLDKELVTPTGAAIVKVLASRFAPFPRMRVSAIGYGAGSRDFHGQPNVVRLTVGESLALGEAGAEETISILEANLDDLNPQLFGYVMERALDDGALDVFATPVQMKKDRPGVLLTVLARPEDASRLARLIFAETTTLGVRWREERRQALLRRSLTVETPWGPVRLKIAHLNGTVMNYAPEFDDCRRIAAERQVPLKTVMQEAVRAYLDQKNG
jgi:uncharacterized protein (TIGR00299 family) protein